MTDLRFGLSKAVYSEIGPLLQLRITTSALKSIKVDGLSAYDSTFAVQKNSVYFR